MANDSNAWKEEARKLFAYESEMYELERTDSHDFAGQLQFVLSQLGNGGGCVLDIGCAAGSEIPGLRSQGFHVVGLDYTPQMIVRAKRRFAADPQVTFARADAERLPFRSGSFDHVVCLGVLEYLPAYGPAISEAARVLRPGGLAIFTLPTAVSPGYIASRLVIRLGGPAWRAARRIAGVPVHRGDIPSHHRNLCVPWRFCALLERSGLRVERRAYSNFMPAPLDRVAPRSGSPVWRELEQRLGDSKALGWLGHQFLVSGRKG